MSQKHFLNTAMHSYFIDDFQNDDSLAAQTPDQTIEVNLTQSSIFTLALLSDAFVIQRFLSAIAQASSANLVWHESAINAISASPGTVPLLCSAIMLDNVSHQLEGGGAPMSASRRTSLRKRVEKHRLAPNWFDSADSIVCADYISKGWHKDIYASPGILKDRNALESLLSILIDAKIDGLEDADLLRKWKDSLAAVIYELFENTHIHGRFDYDGNAIVKDVMRVLLIRRISVTTGGNQKKTKNEKLVSALEISVLDSGVGFFGSRHARRIQPSDNLEVEWQNLKECLEVHVDEPATTDSHRGIGLYEVLRALHFLKGSLQVRSGRVFGYRSFFSNDLSIQMEPKTSNERPGMPKVRLFDFNDPYRPTPTRNTEVRGVVARTLVPLGWSK
ncbi:MAG: hypothetical protein EON54_05420 [Alcaligenaceae bacterium]|nr:MAG: hypothetical protein EON54_05420 [Alcaligenaceae bacterium]